MLYNIYLLRIYILAEYVCTCFVFKYMHVNKFTPGKIFVLTRGVAVHNLVTAR